MSKSQKNRLIACILLTSSLITIAIVLYILKLNGEIQLLCPIKTITGFECPGCGVTRMITSMLGLEVYQAFRYNPFIFLAIPWVLYLYISIWTCYIKHGVVADKLANNLMVFAITLIIFGIIRNFSWLSFLKPTII